ncbi:hypothetical protein F5J12DRAFT_731438, partial [Pisolithus orientalis]|uniref:uncharacterized protein n=1 Tax=Pisolithus orientalis TaxID=936130 RepID=UPI0022250D76
LALSMFLTLECSSESTYEKIQKAVEKCFPDARILSFHQSKHILTNLSGVTSVVNHMCINSCAAFMGPLSDLKALPRVCRATL